MPEIGFGHEIPKQLGLKSAVYNQEWVMMARVRYFICNSIEPRQTYNKNQVHFEKLLRSSGYPTVWILEYVIIRSVAYTVLQGVYSRVHISSDTAFLKILKKPSIEQE